MLFRGTKRHIICFADRDAHSVLLLYAAFVQCGSGIPDGTTLAWQNGLVERLTDRLGAKVSIV
jgi:hypothetical protein